MRNCPLRGVWRLVAASTLAAAWTVAAPAKPAATAAAVPSRPWSDARALGREGAIAFVWRHRLYTLTAGRVTDLGPGAYPVWSSGPWLAYLRPGQNGLGRLWIAKADGQGRREVLAHRMFAPGGYAWATGSSTLVAGAATNRYPVRGPGGLFVVDAGSGRVHTLATPTPFVDNIAVGTDAVAYSVTLAKPSNHAVLYSQALRGGAASVLVRAREDDGLRPVAWVGQRILYWLDPQFSASIAADGLTLYAVGATGHAPAQPLAFTLAYGAWLGPAGPGFLYTVIGGTRTVAQNKRIALCDLAAARCTPVAGGARFVALDPAWSAGADTLAYVQARNLGNNAWGLRSTAALRAWIRSRTLWLSGPGGRGARAVVSVGGGVADPRWVGNGRAVVYLRRGGVWMHTLATGRTVQLVGGFLSQTSDGQWGYYGYADPAASYAARGPATP